MRRPLAVLLAALGGAGCSDEKPVQIATAAPVPDAPSTAAMTTPRATDRFPTARGDLVVTPLEHASVLFGWDGKAVYVDPTSTAIADASLPKADVVLVTHAHFDHLDAVALSRLRKPGTIVVGPRAVAEETQVDVVVADADARRVRDVGVVTVPMYNAQRGPAPGLLFHPRGSGEGYLLDFGGTRVYVSGDTECTPEMRALERVDVAFVSTDLPYTMSPPEAAECVRAFAPKVVFPYHDRGADLAPLVRALGGTGIDVRLRTWYPRPVKLRAQAMEACAEGHWGLCEEKLDQAKILDPAGERAPLVAETRRRIREGESPWP